MQVLKMLKQIQKNKTKQKQNSKHSTQIAGAKLPDNKNSQSNFMCKNSGSEGHVVELYRITVRGMSKDAL